MALRSSDGLRVCGALIIIVLVASASTVAGTSVPAYAFGAGSFAVPEAPTGIAVGDFNGDGRLDLAVTSGYVLASGMVSILMGRPDGSFAPAVNYQVSPTGFPVVGVASGDFNGDGKPDLVVIATPGFQILFGNGDGTFQAGLGFTLSNAATGVVVADFNRDRKSDVAFAVGGYSNPQVAVLLSNGNGTFSSEVDYTTAGSSSVSVGDLNGDGHLDLVIGGGDAYLGVSVLLGRGDGTFAAYLATPITNNGCGAVAVADLNQDKKSDVVCGPWEYYPGGVTVLIGNGDGTFGSPVFYPIQPVGSGPNVVATADFNGDGKLDIVSANYDGYDTSVFLGNGDGTFKPAQNYPGSINPVAVVAADFNRDGIEDIASVAGYITSASVTVMIGRGDGTFTGHANQNISPYPYNLAAGDFNNDGKQDIVVDSFNNPGVLSILLGNGKGGFAIHEDSNVGNYPSYLTTGDFNADGKLDVVLVDSDPKTGAELLSTLLGNGDGTLQPPQVQTISSGPGGQFGVADFNLDGKVDLATCLQNSTGPSVFLGQGDGTFAAPAFFNAGGTCGDPGSAFTADVNGDHKPDLLVTTYNGISVLLGEGNGSFQPYSAILAGYALQGIGDFNDDGKQDLVVSSGPPFVGIALGNGDGTFQAPQTVFVPAILSVDHPVVGDFNGDGKLDFAFISQSAQVLSILLGNGDGTFGQRIDLPTEGSPWTMAAADFLSGGGLDLAVGNAASQSSGTISVFSNRPVVAFYPNPLQFGTVKIGTTKTLSTKLYNAGGGPLNISSFALTSEYTQTSNCGSILKVGASCAIGITFKPTAVGVHNGSLRIQDNATAKPQAVILRASGAN